MLTLKTKLAHTHVDAHTHLLTQHGSLQVKAPTEQTVRDNIALLGTVGVIISL